MPSVHGTRLNHDVLWYLCRMVHCDRVRLQGVLRNISMASRQLRALASPLLFCAIVLHRSWDADAFRALLDLTTIHPHVRSFSFDRTRVSTRKHPCATPTPEQFSHDARFLATLLQSFSKLETLRFNPVLPRDSPQLRQVVEILLSTALKMPTVRFLHVDMDALFLHQCCPNLTAISTGIYRSQAAWPRSDLITKLVLTYVLVLPMEEASIFAGPRYLSEWTHKEADHDHFKEIQERMPNIRTLVFNPIKASFCVETFVPTLRGFRRLETLALPELRNLHVGYSPLTCVSTRSPEQRLRLRQEWTAGLNRVKTVVVAVFPYLKHLWVGINTKFDLTMLAVPTADEIAGIEPTVLQQGHQLHWGQ